MGDAWTLKGAVDPCGCSPITFGGWTQIGYHSNESPLSSTRNDSFAFNDHAGRLNLHQQWLYAEKAADGSNGLDWGFRVDFMYGTDAPKTQSFGNSATAFDNNNAWDRNGGYGYAMPQLYGEVAYGDLSVIFGHFYTLVGYEVVTAPDNFFYSHALTMFNSEPFTHTGVLATYSGIENVEVYGGWTAGWDTGFDQYGDGSNFLGGFSTNLSDDVAFTYITTIGDFGARSRSFGAENGPSGDGYSHSMVFDVALSDDLNYVFQSDYVGIDAVGGAIVGNDQVGINQYLFYTLSDCWAVGGRAEWWKTDGESFGSLTAGLNYRPHANLVLRPEVRYHTAASDNGAQYLGFADEADYDRWTFGVDAILTY